MTWSRFTIAKLMTGVFWVAVGFAALRYPSIEVVLLGCLWVALVRLIETLRAE